MQRDSGVHSGSPPLSWILLKLAAWSLGPQGTSQPCLFIYKWASGHRWHYAICNLIVLFNNYRASQVCIPLTWFLFLEKATSFPQVFDRSMHDDIVLTFLFVILLLNYCWRMVLWLIQDPNSAIWLFFGVFRCLLLFVCALVVVLSRTVDRTLFFELAMEEDNLITTDGTVNYRGKPAKKSETGTWRACPYILGTVTTIILKALKMFWNFV